ncbi:hypothetical protein [Arthrobacter sp. UYCo732]|uniref:hypothetical protein n=1 Tax=Arthrobacter sp. UYCo732 TaxID=3156336 RepID=UPI003399AB88
MNTLIELLMSGGGLEGASPKQIRAVLDKLDNVAIVVPYAQLPEVRFGVTDDQPFVALLSPNGGANTTKPFEHAFVSPSRAMRAVREAMAIHGAVTTEVSYRRDSYGKARELFLRNRLEAKSVAAGGAQALAEGAL